MPKTKAAFILLLRGVGGVYRIVPQNLDAYSWGEHRLHVLTDGGFTQTMLVVAGEV